MPTVTQARLSGRYLSFAEREEITILRARGCGAPQVDARNRKPGPSPGRATAPLGFKTQGGEPRAVPPTCAHTRPSHGTS